MPKLYFYDTGLVCWLLGVREPAQLRSHPLRGPIFETWVVSETMKHRTNLGKGSLNPIRDTLDRTYLYASNISINQGQQQPVAFVPGEELQLTDADGNELLVRIIAVVGRSSLIEYYLDPRSGRG